MKKLSDAEWTIMEILWKKEKCGLKEIVDECYPLMKWTRNTVHTYLTRMEAKKLVFIDKAVNPHIYRAAVSKDECRKSERKSFLSRVYKGSAGDMIAAFLKEERLTPEEKERLKKILDDMEV